MDLPRGADRRPRFVVGATATNARHSYVGRKIWRNQSGDRRKRKLHCSNG